MSIEHTSPRGSSAASQEEVPYHTTAPPDSGDWMPAQSGRRITRRPKPHRHGGWLLVSLVGLLLIAIIIAGLGLYALDRSYAGRIYPNVTIRGVDVGMLNASEASQKLIEQLAPFINQPLTLTYINQNWTPTLSDLGVRIEIERAISSALNAGRGHGIIQNLRDVFDIYQHGLELPLHLTIDETVMQRYLLQRVEEVERPAVDAQLALNGATVATAPAVMGRQVLIQETLYEMGAVMQDLTPQVVALRTRQVQPQVSDSAVTDAQTQVNSILAGPLTVNVEGLPDSVTWEVSDLATFVRIQRVTATPSDRLLVSIDTDTIQERITTIADATEIKGAQPRVDWNGGDLRILEEGTTGLRVDEAAATELVLSALAAPADQRALILPMATIPPPVTAETLGQLGLRDLLSVGRSDFSGSASYRITNIQAGMRLLNGVLVAPNEEFSFNDTIGQIDGSNGFVEGYAIVRNRTQLEWGGGICQDSTTMFRAAFWAGLPITERWGHSFYISWYNKYAFGDNRHGPGMDAAIFTGALDFKFLNDTGNWLLIQTMVDTNRSLAEVRIYGTNDGRTVSLIGPTTFDVVPAPTEPVYVAEPSRPPGNMRQSDTAREGMTIEFTRVVERAGQVVESRVFQTKFKPWPNIFEVNPADLGPDGKPLPTATPVPTPDPNATPVPTPGLDTGG